MLLFVPEKFDFHSFSAICDNIMNMCQEHYTLQQAITVLLIMQLAAKTQLILQDHEDVIHMSITK